MHNLPHEELKNLSREELLEPYDSAIGGGEDYSADEFAEQSPYTDSQSVTPEQADFTVSTQEGLVSAIEELNNTSSGGTIFVDTDSLILDDLSDVAIEVPITLASGRGRSGVPAATFDLTKPQPLFQVKSGGVRFTGLEFSADETERFDPKDRYPDVPPGDAIYKVGASSGIFIQDAGEEGVEIDNCLFEGFTYAGVSIRRDKATSDSVDLKTYIHHTTFVNNPCDDLGYGVAVRQGAPLVEYCYFDNNRHDITGSGWKNCHYVLRNSVIGPTSWSHAIDVHDQDQHSEHGVDLSTLDRFSAEEVEGHSIAGGRFSIHHNVLMHKEHTGVKFRGIPVKGFQLHGNIHYYLPDANGFGEEGSAYFVAADINSVTPSQIKLSRRNAHHGYRDLSATVGPPGMPTISGLKDTISNLEGTISDLEGAISDLEGTISDQEGTISDLEASLASAQDEIEVLKPKADQRDRLKQNLDSLLNSDS